MSDIVVKNIESLQDTRVFLDGSQRSVVKLPSLTVGRGVYKPGWRWSTHAGPQTGKTSAHHLGWIASGKMVIRTDGGEETTVGPGDVFEVGPGHDAWVLGKEPCVAFDFALPSQA